MNLSLIFAAGLADLIQVVIFLIIMGAGAFFQIVSAAAEKKKAEAGKQGTLKTNASASSLKENLIQTAAETVKKPRQSKRKKAVDAAIADETFSRRKTSISGKTAAFVPVASASSQQPTAGLASEIHQLLHDPQSIRQAVILSEVLTRKHF